MTVVILTLLGALAFKLHERRAERLERLNRESWETLRATRRIHDQTAEALQAMFDEARLQTHVTKGHEIQK